VDLFPSAGDGHVPRRRLRLEHRPLQVDVDDVIEFLFADGVGAFFAVQADTVHEDVELSEMRGDVVDHALRFADGEHVELRGESVVPLGRERGRETCGFFRRRDGDGDLRARRGE
jgi:hypothetical protein